MSSHRRSRAGAAVLGLVLAALSAAPAHALDESRLKAQLSTLHQRLGSQAAALVVDARTGKVLFQRRATTSLSPASNEKLFTTAAALLKFGPRATLETRVLAPPGGEVEDGSIDDLHLVGAGDPALNDVALKALVAELKTAGVRRVRGGILADESLFDRRRGSYDSGFRPDDDLGGWLGALTWSHGRPDPAGGPALEAAERLHAFLRAAKITLGRTPRVQTLPRADVDLAAPLATVDSPPMAQLAATTNQPSDNFYAEMLVKGLGARFGSAGTTAAGIAVMRTTLRGIGVRPTAMVDGSGLSRADKASPRQLVTLLQAMDRQPTDVRTAWRTSLPVIGRSGTLAGRMRGTAAEGRCSAKTGTLRGVSALSGFCTTTGGRSVYFSLLENAVDALAAKRIEDRMVPKIASLDG
ncbi:D-alanyl-D-alanine carboxypeptidase/D-alanyl-D-alanine-endopeptidase [Conexibacter sp. W3-3-2]|uniref:D-alanyl-D-alanine carboxypeptidase/D-alanyl-D-alanine endopeptidase n=1 Tax=Conexibacter sp. W3-3-2 TaxID=2675227 RepID=UPI0012B911E8|nr:D-alanyl-D-alanine carboxypeptidase/D-alanyl-D-alanine-endopeptidase [Conexibacter sp. W3-3-2]MTD44283.1 D-alanyl-D-alanine carboxypeptidase/D-alanyl-D-alanine-endopeptidase [Conexibacter sp. W3-3-2]